MPFKKLFQMYLMAKSVIIKRTTDNGSPVFHHSDYNNREAKPKARMHAERFSFTSPRAPMTSCPPPYPIFSKELFIKDFVPVSSDLAVSRYNKWEKYRAICDIESRCAAKFK